MNALLVQAIREKRLVAFTYHDKARKAEPQCHGIGTRGTELLRAHVPHDARPAALFDVAKMEDLALLDETFEHPGPGYRRDDSAMVTIFAQL